MDRKRTPAKEIHGDSCGIVKTMRPHSEWVSHEEAHREPTESVVYFRSGRRSPNIIFRHVAVYVYCVITAVFFYYMYMYKKITYVENIGYLWIH